MDTDPDEWIENQFLDNAPVSFSDQEKCCLFLIEHGANVNLHNEVVDRMSLLNTAVYYDLDRIADALIKAGADLNSVNGQVFTIYAWATEHCSFMFLMTMDFMQARIHKGIDPIAFGF